MLLQAVGYENNVDTDLEPGIFILENNFFSPVDPNFDLRLESSSELDQIDETVVFVDCARHVCFQHLVANYGSWSVSAGPASRTARRSAFPV